jgi:hypothetical protein
VGLSVWKLESIFNCNMAAAAMLDFDSSRHVAFKTLTIDDDNVWPTVNLSH